VRATRRFGCIGGDEKAAQYQCKSLTQAVSERHTPNPHVNVSFLHRWLGRVRLVQSQHELRLELSRVMTGLRWARILHKSGIDP